MLIDKLIDISRDEKCYKVILTTQEKNIDFYHKCKFDIQGYNMEKYI